jgi:hypothetical protein
VPDRAPTVPGTLPHLPERGPLTVPPPLGGTVGTLAGDTHSSPQPGSTVPGTLEGQLLALLADGHTHKTGDLIAGCPGVPGWLVRRQLDDLAVRGLVWWRPGKNNAGSRTWRLNPTQSRPVPEAQPDAGQ